VRSKSRGEWQNALAGVLEDVLAGTVESETWQGP
jgi:hypothetical protein